MSLHLISCTGSSESQTRRSLLTASVRKTKLARAHYKISSLAMALLICWPNAAQAHSGLPPIVFTYPVGVIFGLLLASVMALELKLTWRKRLMGIFLALALPTLLAYPIIVFGSNDLFLSGLAFGGILSYGIATAYYRIGMRKP